jgi:hypothetical protein
MARYDLGYGMGYGREYRRSRRVFEPDYESTGRERLGYGREMQWQRGRRLGYGREYFGEEREPMRYGRAGMGYGMEYGRSYGVGYGQVYRTRGYGGEYEKSRWQTDYGDPFRDRERGTPIRVMRGEFGQYGGEYMGGGYGGSFRRRRRRWF